MDLLDPLDLLDLLDLLGQPARQEPTFWAKAGTPESSVRKAAAMKHPAARALSRCVISGPIPIAS